MSVFGQHCDVRCQMKFGHGLTSFWTLRSETKKGKFWRPHSKNFQCHWAKTMISDDSKYLLKCNMIWSDVQGVWVNLVSRLLKGWFKKINEERYFNITIILWSLSVRKLKMSFESFSEEIENQLILIFDGFLKKNLESVQKIRTPVKISDLYLNGNLVTNHDYHIRLRVCSVSLFSTVCCSQRKNMLLLRRIYNGKISFISATLSSENACLVC